jgi:hypothetical protein
MKTKRFMKKPLRHSERPKANLNASPLSGKRVARDHLVAKLGAQFWSPLLGGEIHGMNAKPSRVSIRPLVIIEQAPEKAAAHRYAFGDGTLEMHEGIAQIDHVADAQYPAIGV